MPGKGPSNPYKISNKQWNSLLATYHRFIYHMGPQLQSNVATYYYLVHTLTSLPVTEEIILALCLLKEFIQLGVHLLYKLSYYAYN